jgi:predicted MFS family arabinose efflux permease
MSHSPLTLLHHNKPFCRLWIGLLLSFIGDVLAWSALLWQVSEREKNPSAVGTLLLCFALPSAFSGTPIGLLLDRYQPRTIMVVDNLLRAVFIGLIPLLDKQNMLTFPVLCLLAGLCGVLTPATQVGSRLAVPAMVGEDEQPAAQAALSQSEQIGMVIGPLLAGVLIARFGTSSTLWMDAISFLIMAWALLAVPRMVREKNKAQVDMPKTQVWRDLGQPVLLAITVLSALFFFSYGPTEAVMPLFVKHTLRTNATGMGWIWCAVGLGSVFGGFATSRLAKTGRIALILCAIMIGWGACQWFFALTTSVIMASLWFFIGGVIWGPYLALKTLLIQERVPEERQGGVMGLHQSFLSPTMPLGAALGGLLLRHYPPTSIVAWAGMACIVGGVIAMGLLFARRQSAA